MPVIGGVNANDTAAEQLVENARAAVNKLVEIGVAERTRIGIAGHSYGGLMTATLLAQSDLFAAGVALSGVYDLPATPFGFQNESRTFWDASTAYTQLSAYLHADHITAPLLLVHGEVDTTIPSAQSLQMFRALEGLGRTARLVILPYEGHAYTAQESVLHVAWEISRWFDRYLKQNDLSGTSTP
jgi:dipeptidyl aminopeptidase/acylaminoacyl peptidase